METDTVRRLAIMSLRELEGTAERYWNRRGKFGYVAFSWINRELFAGTLPTPMIAWAPTMPYGHCLALTDTKPEHPVITMASGLWRKPGGPARCLDVLIHECVHISVECIRRENPDLRTGWRTSHDNRIWPQECTRVAGLLGFPSVVLARTRSVRRGQSVIKVLAVEGAVPMRTLAGFPESLRPAGYHESASLPFPWDVVG